MQKGSGGTGTGMETVRGVAVDPDQGHDLERGAVAGQDLATVTTGHTPGPGRVTVGKYVAAADGYQPSNDSGVSW